MLQRLVRWAREGSIATLTAAALACAPLAAEANWLSDMESAMSKVKIGGVLTGLGAAVAIGGKVAAVAGATSIVVTAAPFVGIGLAVIGLGVAGYGAYKYLQAKNQAERPRVPPSAPTGPGEPSAPGGPTGPGRIERPGRVTPGIETEPTAPAPTPGAPGTVSGPNAPGNNDARVRPVRVPRPAPATSSSTGRAMPAGIPR